MRDAVFSLLVIFFCFYKKQLPEAYEVSSTGLVQKNNVSKHAAKSYFKIIYVFY